jgi:hypothetical protein
MEVVAEKQILFEDDRKKSKCKSIAELALAYVSTRIEEVAQAVANEVESEYA